MPLPDRLAQFNRVVTNPIARRFAGWLPPFVILIHRGRNTGREHRTPLMAFRTGDGFAIVLTYGVDRDWIKNVQAAGRCTLVRARRRIEVVEPVVLAGPEALAPLPSLVRLAVRGFGVDQVMRLRRAESGSSGR